MEPTGKSGSLSSYLRDIRRFRVLSRDEERSLLRDVDAGRAGAVDRLVTSNLGFVVRVAREYRSLGMPFEDLLNEGNLGLLEAARRFDPARGTKFVTYAVWWIRKSILRAVAENAHLVRIPDVQARRLRRIREAQDRLYTRLGYHPTRRELARHLATSVAHIERVLQRRVRETSIDARIGEAPHTLADRLEDLDGESPERRSIQRNLTRQLFHAYRRLERHEQLVIALRFGLSGEPPRTLQDVGQRMGLSRERVRQIERKAKERMRKLMQRRRWDPVVYTRPRES